MRQFIGFSAGAEGDEKTNCSGLKEIRASGESRLQGSRGNAKKALKAGEESKKYGAMLDF